MSAVNRATIELVKRFEGLFLKAYVCPAGVLTIGYGHTGKYVTKGLVISKEKADELLENDLEKFATGVSSLVKVSLNENQFGALVSFAFNVGIGAFGSSTLLKKLNAGNFSGAASEFARWNKAGGIVLGGLVSRREAEKELFLLDVE